MLHKQFLSASLLLVLLPGCASISISKESWSKPKTTNPSYLVKVESPNSSKEVRSVQSALEDLLASNLVNILHPHRKAFWTRDNLQDIIHPNSSVPHHILHVSIIKQRPGSRLLRSLIGWSTGRTTLQTHVTLYSPPNTKSKASNHFTTQGGSGSMPGALFTDPILFLPSTVVLAATTGLTYDAKRTAKTIAQAVLQNHAGIDHTGPPKRISDPWYAKAFPHLRKQLPPQ